MQYAQLKACPGSRCRPTHWPRSLPKGMAPELTAAKTKSSARSQPRHAAPAPLLQYQAEAASQMVDQSARHPPARSAATFSTGCQTRCASVLSQHHRARFECASPRSRPPRTASLSMINASIRMPCAKRIEKRPASASYPAAPWSLVKEYCVLIDPMESARSKSAPPRVFPGPYDTSSIRARAIASTMRMSFCRNVPCGYVRSSRRRRKTWLRRCRAASKLDKELYFPVTSCFCLVSRASFPFNRIEVLSPHTGEAVVGNDHSNVFIETIGIDQRAASTSAILTTGESVWCAASSPSGRSAQRDSHHP